MAIQFKCSCGKLIRVNEEMAGKTGKCPSCGERVKVPPDAQRGQQDSSGMRLRLDSFRTCVYGWQIDQVS